MPFDTRTKEHRGHTITVKWYRDEDMGEPWKEHDGHGPVTGWERRDKRPGELILNSDRGSKRFYDFAEAVRIAKRDGWDTAPYGQGTKGERAHRAAMADFEYLRRWCNDDWFWCGRTVSIDGYEYQDSLWGIDSDSTDQFTEEAFADAVRWLDNEITESERAACSDIATVAA